MKAIAEDSPSALLMPFAIAGKNLPSKYVRAALCSRAGNIIRYLFCNNKKAIFLPPRQLLFYVCANWSHEAAVALVKVLEEDKPGLVKDSLDVWGHDALWYTLYQKDGFSQAAPAAPHTTDPLASLLIQLGCDPDRKSPIGLSYRDLNMSPQT